MKFLCVECNEQMKLRETLRHNSGASLSIIYGCPNCMYQFALLTNPAETQLVTSLGVSINPAESTSEERALAEKMSGCPFARALADGAGPEAGAGGSGGGLPWTAAAIARLDKIPSFIRPMAKAGIEQYAKENGIPEIDEAVLDRARGSFEG